MIESVRRYAWQHWRRFSRGRPGKRFQERYRRRQEQGHGRWGVRRVLNLSLGVLIVAVSAVGGLLPGPGWGTAIIGFVLIAGEFLPAARLLDRAELALRGFLQLVRDAWGHSWAGKVLVISVTVFVVAVLGYAVYALLFAN
jgi:hypothetical protein